MIRKSQRGGGRSYYHRIRIGLHDHGNKNEDAVTTEVGCKGDVVYSENANESGTITITLQELLPLCRVSEAWRQAGNRSL